MAWAAVSGQLLNGEQHMRVHAPAGQPGSKTLRTLISKPYFDPTISLNHNTLHLISSMRNATFYSQAASRCRSHLQVAHAIANL